jgi:hypothetical protein
VENLGEFSVYVVKVVSNNHTFLEFWDEFLRAIVGISKGESKERNLDIPTHQEGLENLPPGYWTSLTLGVLGKVFLDLENRQRNLGLCFVGIDLKVGPQSSRKIGTKKQMPLKINEIERFSPRKACLTL